MSLMKLTKAELVSRVEELLVAEAGLTAEVDRLNIALAAATTPLKPRSAKLSFNDFCVGNPDLPVLLQPGDRMFSRCHCPTCNAEVPTNKQGVCSRCAPTQFAEYSRKAS